MLNSDPEPTLQIDLGDHGDDQSIGSIRTGTATGLPWWVPLIKYGFQCVLTLFVMLFCAGMMIVDIVALKGPGVLSSMCFPVIASTMSLHFQLKSATRPLKVLYRHLVVGPGQGRSVS